ncbi:MAG TPA: hypothetical protein ENN61_06940, partial [Bacteroidaceae bacterium]|nr:hypothetical protein [Bacteroidaceae bacterium]
MRSLSFMLLAISVSCVADVRQSVIFEDQFNTLPDGPIASNICLKPYYFLPEAIGNAGDWMVATSMRNEGFNYAWRVNSDENGKYLSQTFKNLNSHYEPLSLITHPLIIAGNRYWEDYSVEFSFSPGSAIDKCGLVFRYQDERNFYFFGMEGNTIMLKQVHNTYAPKRPLERILDFTPFIWQPGEIYKGNVSLRRDKIYALLNDSISLHARDTTFKRGRVGLLSDMPADFYSLETRILNSEHKKFSRLVNQIDKMTENYISSNPQMVIWKKLDIHRLGGDINIRFGDLNGDGIKDVIIVQSRKNPGSNENEIVCITAINFDGEILWQYGKPVEKYDQISAPLPVHIHDLDGDGEKEVIFINGGRLYVRSGQTGQLKRSTGFSPGFSPEAMIFADLMGVGRDNCIVIGDRNSFIMALNDKFKVLWQTKTESGSHPVNVDLDGDQKDEILFGYNILDPEGNIIRDAGGSIGDDCNGVAITGRMDQDKGDRR